MKKGRMILNAALALLFYVCEHAFLFKSCSIGKPQYDPEVWHQTPGKSYIWFYSPLVIGRFFSFLILYTVCRAPWTRDQSVARPLPTKTE
jgi:hypothetical protein